MEFAFVVIGVVAAVVAAFFGLPTAIEGFKGLRRDEFALSERKPAGVVVLRRTKKPPVQIRRTWIFDHAQIATTDARGSTDWRIMEKGNDLILAVDGVVPGDMLLVEYRTIGRSEVRLEREATGSRELRTQRDAKRAQLDEDENAWKMWQHRVI